MTPAGLPKWAHATLIGALALLVYGPSLWNGFALDDVPAVAQDERIRDIRNVPGLLVAPYLTYLPPQRSPYRPITTLSYVASWALGGGHAAAFHAINVALHVATSLLLWSLLTALGASVGPALYGAMIFSVHPVHVEAVAGVVGRADVLSTMFVLLALRLHLASTLRPGLRAVLVGCVYLLALGSKESAVVLPLLLVLVEGMRKPTPTLRDFAALAPTLVAMSIALGAFLLVRTSVLGGLLHLDIAAYIAVLPTGVRVSTAIANFAVVARLLLFPWDLSPEYGPGVILPAGLGDPRFWLGIGTLGLCLAVIRRGLRGKNVAASRWLVAGAVWVALSFVLLSNLFLPMPMWIAERTLYLASVGISLILVGALQRSPNATSPLYGTAFIGLTAVVISAGLFSADRSRIWRNDDSLFGDLVERHPESFRAQSWVGGRLVEAGQVEQGIVWLEQAVALNPNSALLTLDYVRALLLVGRSEEAEAIVRPFPAHLHPSSSVFLAQSLIFQGRTDEAAEVVRTGLTYFPSEPRLIDQARLLGIGG